MGQTQRQFSDLTGLPARQIAGNCGTESADFKVIDLMMLASDFVYTPLQAVFE